MGLGQSAELAAPSPAEPTLELNTDLHPEISCTVCGPDYRVVFELSVPQFESELQSIAVFADPEHLTLSPELLTAMELVTTDGTLFSRELMSGTKHHVAVHLRPATIALVALKMLECHFEFLEQCESNEVPEVHADV